MARQGSKSRLGAQGREGRISTPGRRLFRPPLRLQEPPRLQRARRHGVAALGPVDEVDVVPLGDRGDEAGDLRGLLAKEAPLGEVAGGAQARLQPVGEGGRAVERHAQPVVELAEIGVGGDIGRIEGRVEAAGLQLELVKGHAERVTRGGIERRPDAGGAGRFQRRASSAIAWAGVATPSRSSVTGRPASAPSIAILTMSWTRIG